MYWNTSARMSRWVVINSKHVDERSYCFCCCICFLWCVLWAGWATFQTPFPFSSTFSELFLQILKKKLGQEKREFYPFITTRIYYHYTALAMGLERTLAGQKVKESNFRSHLRSMTSGSKSFEMSCALDWWIFELISLLRFHEIFPSRRGWVPLKTRSFTRTV